MSNKAKIASIDAKIKKLTEERAELVALSADEIDTDCIDTGYVITFKYGRGDKVVSKTGTVLGRKVQEKTADLIKVAVGEGFDAEIVTIYPNAVTKIDSAPSILDQPAE